VRARSGANVLVNRIAPIALSARVACASTVSAKVKVALNVVDVLDRRRVAHALEGVVVVDLKAATDNGEVAKAARERIQHVVAVPTNEEVWRSGECECWWEYWHDVGQCTPPPTHTPRSPIYARRGACTR